MPALNFAKLEMNDEPLPPHEPSEAEKKIIEDAKLNKLTGPSEEEWDNFGIEPADDKE